MRVSDLHQLGGEKHCCTGENWTLVETQSLLLVVVEVGGALLLHLVLQFGQHLLKIRYLKQCCGSGQGRQPKYPPPLKKHTKNTKTFFFKFQKK